MLNGTTVAEQVNSETYRLPLERQVELSLRSEIISKVIKARTSNKFTQRDLAEKTGIKQSVIARIERCHNSPQLSTLIKLLQPLGYTIDVVPISESDYSCRDKTISFTA